VRSPTAIRAAIGWLRHPKTTVRWRLTLLYGGLFLVCGAALLAITYTLVDNASVANVPFAGTFIEQQVGPAPNAPKLHASPRQSFQTVTAAQRKAAQQQVAPPIRKLLASQAGRRAIFRLGSDQRISDLHSLIIESSIALAIMALISGGLGWLVAGRVLRPLRTMTTTTQLISEANLNLRLAMDGPPDELRQLADTIDGLLGRLETAFTAQRRFVANASHELRTPLTAARALLEMVLSDPHATVETFRTTCRQVLEESEEQEQLIDALLALARGQRGIDHHETLDLSVIVWAVVQDRESEAAARALRLGASFESAPVSGDSRLIGRLASNLVDNALRHNTPGGHVLVTVENRAGEATLKIVNSGPVVPADEVSRLLQPFQRLAMQRTGPRDGVGLGLSIVAAIANAHEAALDVRPGSVGGLEIEVRFPRVPEDEPITPVSVDPVVTPELPMPHV
jgi:signal transduction histidine kinase